MPEEAPVIKILFPFKENGVFEFIPFVNDFKPVSMLMKKNMQ
jgi:hypothetical protein